ncbi:MAG: hypothetical protein ACTS5I_17245, partial [Rhodanobacter sp.]
MSTPAETGASRLSAGLPAGLAVSTERPAPISIARHEGDNPFAFELLRERGIALIQALSGAVWSDYNYHDPGVTLLEA